MLEESSIHALGEADNHAFQGFGNSNDETIDKACEYISLLGPGASDATLATPQKTAPVRKRRRATENPAKEEFLRKLNSKSKEDSAKRDWEM